MAMSKEVIAVDVDEVLFPFVANFLEHDKAIHGGDTEPKHFTTYEFKDVLGIELDEAVARCYDFCATDHSHIEPIDQAKDAIIRLSQDYELAIVTARHPQFEANTARWLDQYLDGFFSSTVHIGHALVVENPKKKIDICSDLGAIALIDDSLSHVTECAEAGVEGILFGDYPWNQADVLPEGVTRCLDWRAVLEHFDA